MTPEQVQALEQIAERRNYGRGPNHAKQVNKLSVKIYDEVIRLGLLDAMDEDKVALEVAALLHDIGLPGEPHNEVAFDFLNKEMPKVMTSRLLSPQELSTILYCVLWHRGKSFVKRGTIDISNPAHIKKIAAILRVADALDRTLQQVVKDVSLSLKGRHLIFTVSSSDSIAIEMNRAQEKADLMTEAYSLMGVTFEHAKR